MRTSARDPVIAIFRDPRQARMAIDDLKSARFSEDRIGLLAHGGENGERPGAAIPRGTGVAGAREVPGDLGGGALGGFVGAAAAVVIPGVGPVIAAGTMAAAVSAAASGVPGGGVLGVLAGMGVPEAEARFCETEFKAGYTVVTVRAGRRSRAAADIMRRYDGFPAGQSEVSGLDAGPGGAIPGAEPVQSGQQPGARQEEDFEAAYLFGRDESIQLRYHGEAWDDAEASLRQEWQARYPDRPWDRSASAIREGWEEPREVLAGWEKDVLAAQDVAAEPRPLAVPVTAEEAHLHPRPLGEMSSEQAGPGA